MQSGGEIQLGLQRANRHPHHEDVEGAAAEHAVPPEEGEEILRDHEVGVLRMQKPPVASGQPFVPGEQRALTFRALLAQAAGWTRRAGG